MNYQETIDFLYSQLPMFTRDGVSAFKKNLDNTFALCAYLGYPQQKFKSVHIAGTNGKGSTSHMLAAVFQQAGYKTGLYTSPHLLDFRERIRLDGETITTQEVVEWVQRHKVIIEKIRPSFFELTVAMAFDYFARQEAAIVIVEVGLGGLLDSTNIIQPDISVVTNISYDHMNLLGNTLPEIAEQKAGIIKANTPVVIGEHQQETDFVFRKIATEKKAPIYFAQDQITLKELSFDSQYITAKVFKDQDCWFEQIQCDLNAKYQVKNLTTVFATLLCAKDLGYLIADVAIKEALKQVKNKNQLYGRWQTLQHTPQVIVDTGHNEAGINEVLRNLETCKYGTLHMIIGMVSDKDISKVLSMLPDEARYYFCKANLPRAISEFELSGIAMRLGKVGQTFATVALAIENAMTHAKINDLVFIGGSTFVVAEALSYFNSGDTISAQ